MARTWNEIGWSAAPLVVFGSLAFGALGTADAKPVPAHQDFTCTATAVWDGDGPVWCAEGPRLRIAGIAARETDGTCRPGHPCPAASWTAARDALVDLLGGSRGRRASGHVLVEAPPMACLSVDESYGRTVAQCTLADGRDLGRAMLATGTVAQW